MSRSRAQSEYCLVDIRMLSQCQNKYWMISKLIRPESVNSVGPQFRQCWITHAHLVHPDYPRTVFSTLFSPQLSIGLSKPDCYIIKLGWKGFLETSTLELIGSICNARFLNKTCTTCYFMCDQIDKNCCFQFIYSCCTT